MKQFLYLALSLLLCSCGTSRHVQMQVAEHIQKDTVYLSNIQYDSIYVLQDKYTDRSKDTILIRQHDVEYRYKLLHDTIERIKFEVRHDSIPYEVRITEVKEVRKPPNMFDYLFYMSFGILIGILGWRLRHIFV